MSNKPECDCRMSKLFNVVCGKPAQLEGFDPETSKVTAHSCFDHARITKEQFPDLRWRDVGFEHDSPAILLREVERGIGPIEELFDEVRDCFDFGIQPSGAMLGKLAYLCQRMAEKARLYSEKVAP